MIRTPEEIFKLKEDNDRQVIEHKQKQFEMENKQRILNAGIEVINMNMSYNILSLFYSSFNKNLYRGE